MREEILYYNLDGKGLGKGVLACCIGIYIQAWMERGTNKPNDLKIPAKHQECETSKGMIVRCVKVSKLCLAVSLSVQSVHLAWITEEIPSREAGSVIIVTSTVLLPAIIPPFTTSTSTWGSHRLRFSRRLDMVMSP